MYLASNRKWFGVKVLEDLTNMTTTDQQIQAINKQIVLLLNDNTKSRTQRAQEWYKLKQTKLKLQNVDNFITIKRKK
jgi:ribosomal protein L11 methylase PrmA